MFIFILLIRENEALFLQLIQWKKPMHCALVWESWSKEKWGTIHLFCFTLNQRLISRFKRCLGTGQHLKNRYGSGYLLELKLKSLSSETSGSATVLDVETSRVERKQGLTAFITNIFSSAKIQESFEDRIIFSIAQDNVTSLADTFKSLEEGYNFL